MAGSIETHAAIIRVFVYRTTTDHFVENVLS